MSSYVTEIACRLAQNAEAVCRHYLSNGRREGRYWIVGDVVNTPGRSLYVRLVGPLSGKGAAGKWTDSAVVDQHGDLLDLIALSCGYDRLADVLAEARRFLGLPHPKLVRPPPPEPSTGLPQGVRRLLVTSSPLAGSLAETYLRARGIAVAPGLRALRFIRAASTGPPTRRPEPIATKPGWRCSPRSPTLPATSPACIAPGSIRRGSTRPRSRHHGARSAKSPVTACGSGPLTT
jgi:hypothetical protein